MLAISQASDVLWSAADCQIRLHLLLQDIFFTRPIVIVEILIILPMKEGCSTNCQFILHVYDLLNVT